ncbi:male meiosis chromosome separation [Desmophyllum pertusum]|uniref:Male meiosis chromosome separation n=1 Tax=Desmophyllum pertusum TaxID=174260 RepID=A0A9W9ZCS3_9CNID|nr:male meiosis chromosome separation [Desmophyllum pertusum]
MRVKLRLDCELYTKILVVNVQSSEELNRKEDDTRSENDSSPGSDDDGLEGGLVDVVSLGKDVLSFQNFFKTWLLDGGTDQEHLRITLPSAFTQDSEGDHSQEHDTGLTLKCDLHERVLDPLHLPYQSSFTVCSEPANLTSKGVAITKPNVLTYPVYNLTAVKLVKTDAVCESVPYIVRPTLCWKLDWEDLESNQQHFYALCSVLKERGVSLLAKTSGYNVTSRGRQQTVSASPHGHFLLLPSDNSLLLKSIAVSEMMLPSDVQSPVEGPCDSTLSVVASCLDQIDVSNSYNPLLLHSDLYKCLISQSVKNNSASKPLKRKLFQGPQKSQASKQDTSCSTNQQAKRATPRAQVRRVVFTAPKESAPQAPQTNEFRSAATVFSTSKRFRSNSAANLYNSSPPSFLTTCNYSNFVSVSFL